MSCAFFKRDNVLKTDEYEIDEAYIFSEGNIEIDGKKIYMPIYMIMFLNDVQMDKTVYKLDLAGL